MKHELFDKLEFSRVPEDLSELLPGHLNFDNGYSAVVIEETYYAKDVMRPYKFMAIASSAAGCINEDEAEKLLQKVKSLPKIKED